MIPLNVKIFVVAQSFCVSLYLSQICALNIFKLKHLTDQKSITNRNVFRATLSVKAFS
jgi:hypothetical protein